MENSFQLHFPGITGEQQEILIAELSDIGFDGFEQGKDFLNACISQDSYIEHELKTIVDRYRLPYTIELLQPRNWNEEWERSFEPVLVGNFCAIRAAFHPPAKSVEHEVIITPKMSFGTGHHATTFLVIRQMKVVNFRNKKVFDFGTGTGVLAILAEKLGADFIEAIDNDDWSIANARENIANNGCGKIQLENAGEISSNHQYDIILANINKHVILEKLPSMAKHLNQQGVLIISGLLIQDEQDIAEAALKEQLIVKTQSQKHDWIVLTLGFKV